MPDINFPEAQPPLSYACGAYALTAALKAYVPVTTTPYPIKLKHLQMPTTEITINGTENNKDLADKIYQITGDLEISGPPTALVFSYKLAPNLSNSPSALAYVAKQYGRTVTVNVIKGFKSRSNMCQAVADDLLKKLPGEVLRCVPNATVNAPGGTGVSDGMPYTAPANDEVQLLCVMNSDHSMHWLARGANGFYDPGDASIASVWPAIAVNADSAMTMTGGYTFTGIWMVLK
ncbi:hypothetical protein D9623_16315 [Azospirillum brasilense]|uniref:Peptidase C39-like domain-containing protein n=1 Tax=Azospirillum brasilense TaxID=192 RepID=A0A0P0F9X5_AZOBR|nr:MULTISPECIES: hypothetical protein [Azospirillum]ALJ36888.1 hypothetical protein AMK58_15320 [Azospirillum brasilense]MDW7555801.1 hypothetical protein [Azospirillum brasilense]MDW7595878.1 hypothetical protein [Azospirillum brasilense]MDW7630883.1 hypothetical protein [Azospirillum brasilense]MDX5951489.1 hypothetical protein [Azospirillum brasilense]